MRHKRWHRRKWPWFLALCGAIVASAIVARTESNPSPDSTGTVLQLPTVDPLPPHKPAPTKEVTSSPAATPTTTKPTANAAPTGKPQPTTKETRSAAPSTVPPTKRESTPKPSPKPSASSTPSSVPAIGRTEEARLHINAHRQNLVGAPPLARYPGMDAVAQEWAEHMAQTDVLQHRPNIAPYKGEVIASGATDASTAVQLWLNSPPHKQIILNPAYTMTGIGYQDGYWVMVFS